jgi:hypothetical protein
MSLLQSIIPDGPGRFGRSRECAALRARLAADARLRHDAELRGAPFWRRAWLELAIEREVRAELRKLFPPGALYTSGDPDGGA